MNVVEASNVEPIDVSDECKELLDAVEYHCSQCDAVHEDIAVLNAKIAAIYRTVVEKTRNRSHDTIVKNWIAAYIVAGGIRQAVCFKRQMHQICGIDSSVVDEVFAAIKERLEFLIGYSLDVCE